MKKVLIIIGLALISLITIVGAMNQTATMEQNSDILRIHIRANSNDGCDQSVKYEIKNNIVDYLIPKLANIESKQDVKNVILQNKLNLEGLADNILLQNGFNYKSNIKICKEEFPTRVYNNVTFESGFYDAVIVELGNAVGDNWWCVIYPPICFTNYSNKNAQNVVYKSKIMEIIDKLINRS